MVKAEMTLYSTTGAAKRLGIDAKTLSRYIASGKVPAPASLESGYHVWTEEQIEQLRELLPKIANGRKTRYQKLNEKQPARKGKKKK